MKKHVYAFLSILYDICSSRYNLKTLLLDPESICVFIYTEINVYNLPQTLNLQDLWPIEGPENEFMVHWIMNKWSTAIPKKMEPNWIERKKIHTEGRERDRVKVSGKKYGIFQTLQCISRNHNTHTHLGARC